MGDNKSPIPMASREWERDRELLIPVGDDPADDSDSKASSSNSASSHHHHHHSGREMTSYRMKSGTYSDSQLQYAVGRVSPGTKKKIAEEDEEHSCSNSSSLAHVKEEGRRQRKKPCFSYSNNSSSSSSCTRPLQLDRKTNGTTNDAAGTAATARARWHRYGACYKVIRSWASKKFMTGCVILFPIAITFYITWWFIHFVDGFFSPIYAQLGINIFGLGFITSITFIFLVGVFMSSWLGASVLGLGEWFIKRMPFVRHIYNASKQISAAISPDQNTQAFKEVAIIRHPRIGEYALGFITSAVILQTYSGEEELCCVYVPTNHLYIGDIFLINSKDVIRPNLSVREGIEIVVSGGMSMPQILSTVDTHSIQVDSTRSARS